MDAVKPLAVDLFCGLGGWAEGFLTEGYSVVGFDIEQHVYGDWANYGKPGYKAEAFNDTAIKNTGGSWFAMSHNNVPYSRGDAIKCGGDWFGKGDSSPQRMGGSKSIKRKAASAQIAKIPLSLARHIARVYYP